MLDEMSYKEPECSLCGGKQFYNKELDLPLGNVPVGRIIDKLDQCFDKNDLVSAEKLLCYWHEEAVKLNDKKGEISILNEQVGLYRKIANKTKALKTIERLNYLFSLIDTKDSVSIATIYLNMATTLKSFGYLDKAINLYDKTYEIYSKKLDKKDLMFAGYYNNRALTLTSLKRYEEAIKCYDNALEIVLFHDKLSLDGAITYVNKAHLMEEYKKDSNKLVQELLSKASDILLNEKIEKTGYYAFVLSKCYPSFEQFQRMEEANKMKTLSEQIYERARNI